MLRKTCGEDMAASGFSEMDIRLSRKLVKNQKVNKHIHIWKTNIKYEGNWWRLA